jgi:hypothetical protein
MSSGLHKNGRKPERRKFCMERLDYSDSIYRGRGESEKCGHVHVGRSTCVGGGTIFENFPTVGIFLKTPTLEAPLYIYIFQNLENCPLKSLKNVFYSFCLEPHILSPNILQQILPTIIFFIHLTFSALSLSHQKHLQHWPTKNIFYSFYLLSLRRKCLP